MPYQDELSYLYSLQRFGIKLGLSNIKDLCSLLGNPHEKISTVHVGGTNGKGSTAAILSTILNKAGYRVGLYTSPHLRDFTERIRINNIPITQERAAYLTSHIRGLLGDRDIALTFFEFTTALALQYFAEEGVDIAIMEVGMGGRLDATNIINPLISIITNVEYDHTEHLGLLLEKIAMEKCGIIKKNIHLVTSERKECILSIIEKYAKEIGTDTYVYGRDFSADLVELTQYYSRFYYNGRRWKELSLETSLVGRHQMFNMGVALYAIELLTKMGFNVTENEAREGVRDVLWPGRLETLKGTPDVLLDGAHNHAGIIALREFIEDVILEERHSRKIVLVFGVLKDKDAHSMIGELIQYVSDIIVTGPDTERGLPVEDLRNIVEGYGVKPYVTKTVTEALSIAYNITSSSDIIIVTGSLYIVGEARALISDKCQMTKPKVQMNVK